MLNLHKLLQRFQLQELAFCDQFLRVAMLSEGKSERKKKNQAPIVKIRGGAQTKGRYSVSTMHIYLYTEQGSLFGLLILSRWASLSGLLRSTTQRQPVNKAQHSRLSSEK